MPLPTGLAKYLDSVQDARARYALIHVLDVVYDSVIAAASGADTVSTGLAATGSDAGTALLLPSKNNIFDTVSPGTGALLDVNLLMGTCRVINTTANDLLIYPPGTAQIGAGAAGLPVIVSSGVAASFTTRSPTTLWIAS